MNAQSRRHFIQPGQKMGGNIVKALKPVLIACLPVLLTVCTLSPALAQPTTAILGALDREVTILEKQLADSSERSVEGIRFVTGEMKGRRVVLARTGVGKVNAAIAATLLIEHFRPSEVIFTGVAGGINPELQTGDIVIATKTAQHDLGTMGPDGFQHWAVRNPVDRKRNPVFFPADSLLLTLAEAASRQFEPERMEVGAIDRTPRVLKGIVVTGDMFVASADKKAELRQRLRADAVEMEGAAVAQVCWQQGIPCLVIRSLSDLADGAAETDFEAFSRIAARNSAALVSALVERLGMDQPSSE